VSIRRKIGEAKVGIGIVDRVVFCRGGTANQKLVRNEQGERKMTLTGDGREGRSVCQKSVSIRGCPEKQLYQDFATLVGRRPL